jgi:hypothetical protein
MEGGNGERVLNIIYGLFFSCIGFIAAAAVAAVVAVACAGSELKEVSLTVVVVVDEVVTAGCTFSTSEAIEKDFGTTTEVGTAVAVGAAMAELAVD